jgi:hypothetical protein
MDGEMKSEKIPHISRIHDAWSRSYAWVKQLTHKIIIRRHARGLFADLIDAEKKCSPPVIESTTRALSTAPALSSPLFSSLLLDKDQRLSRTRPPYAVCSTPLHIYRQVGKVF